jgi:hypothetical protein
MIPSPQAAPTGKGKSQEKDARMKWHPGIRIDKIPVKANVGGLIFVIGIVVLGIVGVPAIRELLIVGLLGGVLFAAVLYWWHNRP